MVERTPHQFGSTLQRSSDTADNKWSSQQANDRSTIKTFIIADGKDP